MSARRLALFAAYSLMIPALLLPPLVLDWPGALPLGVKAVAFAAVWLLSALVVLASWPAVGEDSLDEGTAATQVDIETATHAADTSTVEIRRTIRSASPA